MRRPHRCPSGAASCDGYAESGNEFRRLFVVVIKKNTEGRRLTERVETDWLSESPDPVRPVLADFFGGAASPPVALARLLFAGATRDGILDELHRLDRVAGRDPAPARDSRAVARERLAALLS